MSSFRDTHHREGREMTYLYMMGQSDISLFEDKLKSVKGTVMTEEKYAPARKSYLTIRRHKLSNFH